MAMGGARTIALASVLVGCIAPPGPAGPTLILEVINNTDASLRVSVDWDAGDIIGDAASEVAGCEHRTIDLNEVGGAYRIRVADDEISGDVGAGVVGGYLLVRVVVHKDGSVTRPDRMVYTTEEPPAVARPIGACG